MTREEKARWLSEFYAQVADGGEIQHRGVGKWVNNDAGPDMQINPSRWRIKPEPREWTVTVTSHGITTNAGYSLDDETIKVREVIE